MTDPEWFEPWFQGESWDGWRTVLKGMFAVPMTDDERTFFRTVSERDPPAEPCREMWAIVGRRGGKDSIASFIAAYIAATFLGQDKLRPGERPLVMSLACDRDQAKICLGYTKGYFEQIDLFSGMIERETQTGFELSNGVDIAVATNSFRSVRGRPILAAILDETAFWRDESSANPDVETFNAIKPGLASIPNSLVIGISSPYRRSGLLFSKFRDHFGKASKTLVVKAPTRVLNPTIPQSIIDEAMAEDPAAASAEWMAEFRNDVSAFVSQEAVDACTSPDVLERPRVDGVKYSGFIDPSGGSSDSMTLAIGHSQLSEDKKRSIAVLDAVREIRAPFSPEDAVAEFAALLKSYGIRIARGDRYAAEWCRESFKKAGIEYRPADLSKSEIYRDLLPRLNSGEIDLLDNQRLISQLLGLERRTARGGRDSIDHPPGGKDDLANAAAGVLVYLSSARHQPVGASMGVYSWGGSIKMLTGNTQHQCDGPITEGELAGGFATTIGRY
ncbi:hypothetical protein [Bradyrhizobium elkanii]|uniref:hypothetical protein n=1 Tax=Bradyrhizobium elkanii TaxID=29448 RepID=UPI00222661D0|nr:hypothetical protein [Bradyrhizobium elkanii]MCW2227232.1 hypothetical protein [Bradyrhizobium elkanii]